MHTGQSVKFDISNNSTNPKIIYFEDILDTKERIIATTLLKKYTNSFTFGYQDMLRMGLNIIMHNIVIKLFKQKPRCINPTQSL